MKDLDYCFQLISKTEVKGSHLSLILNDISGGNTERKYLDIIREHSEKEEISLSGLNQDTFDYFIDTYAQQFKIINFWKCPLVKDLKRLETLKDIEYITYFWNQRAESFWNFSKTKSLKGFSFTDFTRIRDISELSNAKNLIELDFGDRIWPKFVVKTLEPLTKCLQLKRLTFHAKKIEDKKIESLAQLQNLDRLEFSEKLFTTPQIAWLKARLPKSVKSNTLQALRTIEKPLALDGKNKNTFIIGKGKPFLDSEIDAAKIKKYVKNFNELYEWFLKHPDALPEKT